MLSTPRILILSAILFAAWTQPPPGYGGSACVFGSDGTCSYCDGDYYPNPYSSASTEYGVLPCDTERTETGTISKTIYVSPNYHECRMRFSTDSFCAKPQECTAFEDFSDPANTAGEIDNPYDSLLLALRHLDYLVQEYPKGDFTIIFKKGNPSKGDLDGNFMDLREHFWIPHEQGSGCQINDEVESSFDDQYHYFRDKNVDLTMQALFCDGTVTTECFNQTKPFDRPTIVFKSLNLHIYTNGGSINVQDVFFDGSDAVYEYTDNVCRRTRQRCCNKASDSILEEFDSVKATPGDGFDLGVDPDTVTYTVYDTLAEEDVCWPTMDDIKLETFEYADFQPKAKNYTYGLFNLQEDESTKPTFTLTGSKVEMIHARFSLHTTIRSFVNIITAGDVTIDESTVNSVMFADGLITNLFDLAETTTNTRAFESPSTADSLSCEFAQCHTITITNSEFTNINDLQWYRKNLNNYLTTKKARYEGYIIHLAQSFADIVIEDSYFDGALPIAPPEITNCIAADGDEMDLKMGVESGTKLELDEFLYSSSRHDAFAAHIMLTSFEGSIRLHRNTFMNSVGLQGAILSVQEFKPLQHNEYDFYNNTFELNYATYTGSVMYIRRFAEKWVDGECGAIYFRQNYFYQNWGCGWSIAPVNVMCLANDNIELEYDGMYAGDSSEVSTYAALNPIPEPAHLASRTLPIADSGHQVIFTENVFFFNLGIMSNAILVYGAKSVLIEENSFFNNGPLEETLLELFDTEHPIFTQLGHTSWALDDPKIAKESSSILLGFCDEIIIDTNFMQSSYQLVSGDAYIGTAINIYKALALHGIQIQNMEFDSFEGLPAEILEQFQDEEDATLQTWMTSKSTNPLVSTNLWSSSAVSNFQNECHITFTNIDVTNVEYHLAESLELKYEKLSRHIFSVPTAKTVLFKHYYDYDRQGDTPNSLDIAETICEDTIYEFDDIQLTNVRNEDATCGFDIMGIHELTIENSVFEGVISVYTEGADNYGIMCIQDKYDVFGGRDPVYTLQGIDIEEGEGRILSIDSKDGTIAFQDITYSNSTTTLPILDIKNLNRAGSSMDVDGLIVDGISSSQGVLYVENSQEVTFTGIEVRNGFGAEAASLVVNLSSSIVIRNSEIKNNNIALDQVELENYQTSLWAVDSELLIENCEFERNHGFKGGAVYVSAVSTVEINDCDFEENLGVNGGAIFVSEDSTVTIDESSFINNYAYTDGGAIYITESYLNVYDTDFTGHVADGQGGVIAGYRAKNLDFQRNTVENNQAPRSSVLRLDSSTIEFIETDFTSNVAGEAALLNVIESELSINDCTFTDNTAVESTAGILAIQTELTIQNSLFTRSEASEYDPNNRLFGDFIQVYQAEIDMTQTTFKNGLANYGGAIYLGYATEGTILDCTFQDNVANKGGAIYLFSSEDVTLSENTFTDNIAANMGSALFLDQVFNSLIKDTTFTVKVGSTTIGASVRNTTFENLVFEGPGSASVSALAKSTNTRAIVIEDSSELYIYDCLFTDLVGLQGPAITYINDNIVQSPKIFIVDTVFKNNVANRGGAMFVDGHGEITVEDSNFEGNQVFNIDGAGIQGIAMGGAVYYICNNITTENCKLHFDTVTFDSNRAQIQGGAIQWDDTRVTNESCIFTNNYAVYGPDIASYAVHFVLETDDYERTFAFDLSERFDARRLQQENFNIDGLVSGQKSGDTQNTFPIIRFSLYDHYGQRMLADNSSKAELRPFRKINQSESDFSPFIVENAKINSLQGLFTFNNLIITTKPGTTVELRGVTDALSAKSTDVNPAAGARRRRLENDNQVAAAEAPNSRNLQDTDQSIAITAEFRSCMRGEIQTLDYECYECPPRTYSIIDEFEDQVAYECVECPQSAECFGLYFIGPKEGYWRFDENSTNFLECLIEGACMGYVDEDFPAQENFKGVCAEGYEGNLCHQCERDYRKFNGVCEPLEFNDDFWFRFIIRFLIGFGFLVFTLYEFFKDNREGTELKDILLKIFTNYTQTIAILSVIGLKLPEAGDAVFGSFGDISFEPNEFLSFETFIGGGGQTVLGLRPFFLELVITSLGPFGLTLIAALFWTIVFLAKHKKQLCKSKAIRADLWNMIVASFVIISFALHPSIIELGFTAFRCTNIGDDRNPQIYLEADTDVKCWEGTHLTFALVAALPSLLFWAVIAPLGVLFTFYLNQQYLYTLKWRAKYGFLLDGYKNNCYFWEIAIIYKKTLLLFFALFVETNNKPLQILVALIFIMAHLSVQMRVKPFEKDELNYLEQFSVFNTFCIAYLALLNNTISANYEFIVIIFMIIALVLNIAFIIAFVISLLKANIDKVLGVLQDDAKMAPLKKKKFMRKAINFAKKVLIKLKNFFEKPAPDRSFEFANLFENEKVKFDKSDDSFLAIKLKDQWVREAEIKRKQERKQQRVKKMNKIVQLGRLRAKSGANEEEQESKKLASFANMFTKKKDDNVDDSVKADDKPEDTKKAMSVLSKFKKAQD